MSKTKKEVKILDKNKQNEDLTFVKPETLSSEQKENLFIDQINLVNEFSDAIRAKQIERLFKLSETKTITLDKKTYHRKPLSAKQHRALVELDTLVSRESDNIKREDLLIELRKKEGLYYFNIPTVIVDKHYEELEDILDSCLLKSYTGIKGDEININEMLDTFKEKYDNSLKSRYTNPL